MASILSVASRSYSTRVCKTRRVCSSSSLSLRAVSSRLSSSFHLSSIFLICAWSDSTDSETTSCWEGRVWRSGAMLKERWVAGGRGWLALVVEEGDVEIRHQNSNQSLFRQLSLSHPIPPFVYPAFSHHMAPSVLPTVSQLLEHVSQLLQCSSQTEAETRSVTLLCLGLKNQIEQTKASVVEERMKQLVCKDEIARLKEMAAPRRSGSKEHICDTVHSSLGLTYMRQSTAWLRLQAPSYPVLARNTLVLPRSRERCDVDPKRVDVNHSDEWRRPRRPLSLGFLAHQEKRNVF